MAVAEWKVILTDTNFFPLGEITNAQEKSVSLGLNKATDTATIKVRMDHPLANVLAAGEGYVKAFRNQSLKFFGPILSSEESGDAANAIVSVNAVSPGWFLSKRLVGKSANGTLFTSLTDRAVIAETLIEEVNAQADTGIATSIDNGGILYGEVRQYLGPASASSAITYQAGPYVPAVNSISELSAGNAGFDWQFIPVDNFDYGKGEVNSTFKSKKIAYFFARPFIGTNRPDALFDYGGGVNNVASYTRTVSKETQANVVYNYTSNGPDVPGYPTVWAQDNNSINKWKRLEDVATADFIDQGLRQTLVNEHVQFRANPRQTVTFEPHIDPQQTGRIPVFGEDYFLGDFVRGRAVISQTGNVRFDSFFRVWNVTFNIDNLGMEKTSITVTNDGN